MLARLESPWNSIKAQPLRWAIVTMLLAVIMTAASVWFAERLQEFLGDGSMTADPARVPAVQVALVLGTSRLMPSGAPNLTFDYRLDAAAALWKAGKARYFIVSGNHTGRYDEPADMRAGLIERGVPPDAIYRDGKGFRTWDSVVRAHKVFGLDRMVIVSQRSHVARALFLARSLGMEAYGFDAREEPEMPLMMRVRPYLAAVLSYYDAWRGVLPHHIGPQVMVGADPAL
ncbi:SanA protein [Enhydrobacter aerosaccus]|uniref:SanA protein n=1 Tax=Enhydrobacter aerosaccus TaxID=225324 RepID=A0A1T4KC51_9HYPH|nr:ElyC/SanA/YdcF family protein [Enhydrobacter aerosaccus]SJZ39999.1 SanA protein [Enhydrobacter aerosaccus]